METRITNITLDGDRFTVFAIINGNEETMMFMPEVTAQDIRNWVIERDTYYKNLEHKRELLIEELMSL